MPSAATSPQPFNAASPNTNHLCVIESGVEFQLTKKNLADLCTLLISRQLKPDQSSSGGRKRIIEEFLNCYTLSLAETEARPLHVVYSKDGSELLNSLLSSYGLTSLVNDMDNSKLQKTIHHFATTSNIHSSAANLAAEAETVVGGGGGGGGGSCSLANLSNFICFLISDFDQNDSVFIKLEEIQLKINNLLSLKSLGGGGGGGGSSHASTSDLASATLPQKRFIIFGWPVLYHCIKNEIVNLEEKIFFFIFFFLSHLEIYLV